jgi:hypothetical protein
VDARQSEEKKVLKRYPLWAWVLLLRPDRVEARLSRMDCPPNLWQVGLGVSRMVHRLIFRSDTVGTCDQPVRRTWRAKLLQRRALRLPFLIAERAVAPLDLSGLVSSRERVLRHLLGAHHDRHQFAYDLEMLSADEGALDELVERARAVVEGRDPRAAWLRDLAVFEGYHESLLHAAERARCGNLSLPEPDARDPDISFLAYLDWCRAQPPTPRATLHAILGGRFSLS